MKRKRKRDKGGRPEKSGKTKYYDAEETVRYTCAGEKSGIQEELAYRALHFMNSRINDGESGGLFLNVGIGAGNCQNSIDKYSQKPHFFIGTDLSLEMLRQGQRLSNRELIAQSFCQGFPFKHAGIFDGVYSISAIQWLCIQQDTDDNIVRFMQSVVQLLKPGGIFVAQFFPNHPNDCKRFLSISESMGLNPSIVMDMPHNNKSKRYYLITERVIAPVVPSILTTRKVCPCSWPYEGTCSLSLHVTEKKAWSSRGVLPLRPEYETRWLSRCKRVHTLYAKKMMALLQNLWIKFSDNPETSRNHILKHKRIENLNIVEKSVEHRFQQRARLEAWSLGTKAKAIEKHLGKYWEQIQGIAPELLIKDAEEEVKYLSRLRCFEHTDLFLLRPKKSKAKHQTCK